MADLLPEKNICTSTAVLDKENTEKSDTDKVLSSVCYCNEYTGKYREPATCQSIRRELPVTVPAGGSFSCILWYVRKNTV